MLSWVLQNGPVILAFGGYFIAGILVFLGYLGMGSSDRRKESEELADSLINRLQQTVEQLTTDIKKLQTDRDAQQKELHVLQGQNEAYLKIITLRDPATAKVFEEAPEIFQLARDTYDLAKSQANSLKKLTDTMEEFLNRMPPVMPVMTS